MMVKDVNDISRLLAEEAEAAEEHRDDDVSMVRSRRTAKEPAQVYSLRVPVEKLEELRRLAAERHLTPSALIRSWVLERLEQESEGQSFLELVRKAVREELVQIRSSALTGDERVSSARARASSASAAKGRKSRVSAAKTRKSGAFKNRQARVSATKSRASEPLAAKWSALEVLRGLAVRVLV